MQSDLVVKAEAEILSFPTKMTNHNQKYSSNNNCEQTRTESSKSNRTLSSSKSENVISRETTYCATDESHTKAHPNGNLTKEHYRQNPGGNGVFVSPTTRLTTSSSISRHSNSESSQRGKEQSAGHDKIRKTSISDIASPLEEVETAENDLPFDQANDNVATKEENRKTSISRKAHSDSGAGNYPGMVDYGNIRNSRVSDFEDSACSPVSTNFESVLMFSPEPNSSKPFISISSRDERNCPSKGSGVTGSGNNYDLVENGGRFTVPPPKYSNLYSITLDQEGVPLYTELYNEQKLRQIPSRLSLIPQQIFEREKVMTPPSTQQGENTNNKNGNVICTITRNDEHSDTVTHELEKKDDDSIFKFPDQEKLTKKADLDRGEKYRNGEKSSNIDVKMRRRSRQRRKDRVLVQTSCTDDEMSMENYGDVTALHLNGLQERSHQAWKSRQRKSSTMRSIYDSKSRPDEVSNVSFGNSDTIYHFDPCVPKRYKNGNKEEEDVSLDRSLNSEYTKTLESEVEDMIKDILFIGNPQKSKPGRRKYRHKPDIERKLGKDRVSKVMTDDGTQIVESDRLGILHGKNKEKIEDDPSPTSVLIFDKIDKKSKPSNNSGVSIKKIKNLSGSKYQAQTYGDDRSSLASAVSRSSSVGSYTVETFQTEKDAIEDPLNTVLGFVEGGLSVMTSALEYALGDHTATKTREDDIDNCQKTTGDYDIFDSCGIHIRDEKVGTESGQKLSRTTKVLSKNLWTDYTGNGAPIDSKNALLLSKKAKRKSEFHEEKDCNTVLTMDDKNEPDCQTWNLGNGPELRRLAIYAARSVHKLQGLEYDESVIIDIYKEVKKIYVTLELPLGIIFLENDGGCFVTKVSPDGSATRSRIVEVGDQLASINGINGSKMRVDDICDAINTSTDRSQIKLVFLRYIGPFRTSAKARLSKDVPDKIDRTTGYKDRTMNTRNKKPIKKMAGFRLFGRGKKNTKNVENDMIGGVR